MIENNRIGKALIISLCSMLAPMIIATRILNTSSALVPLYALGYIITIFAIMYALNNKIIANKFGMHVVVLYFVILIIPIAVDLILNIKLNYFDLINVIIKTINLILFFVLMDHIKIDENSFIKLMNVVVIISVFACLYSFVFEFREILTIGNLVNSNTLKIRSFFANRNQYSAFLVVAFIANTYLCQLYKKKYRFIIYTIQVIGILTTFSRAAFFSIVIIVCMMLLQSKNTKKKFVIVSLIIFIGLAILLGTDVITYISKNYIRMDSSADSGRFTLWKYAWDIFKDSCFLGVGFYTGADIAMERGMGLTQFHSMYFDILVDGGFLEIIFLIFIFSYTYKKCEKCKNHKLTHVYRASLIAFIFHATVESLSIFALSYSDILYTVFYISVPLLISNMYKKNL